jgi:hypothetical protein
MTDQTYQALIVPRSFAGELAYSSFCTGRTIRCVFQGLPM